MPHVVLLVAALLAAFLGHAETNRRLRTAVELRDVLLENRRTDVPFSLEGVVEKEPVSTHSGFTVVDDTGAVIVYHGRAIVDRRIVAGDRILVSGETSYYDETRQHIYARCDTLKVLSHGQPPVLSDVRCSDLADGRHDFRTVRVRGIVRNAFRDEIDPLYAVLILGDGGATLPVLLRTSRSASDLDGYIGAEVRVTGLCNTLSTGNRLHLGRFLSHASLDDITVLRSPETDVFDVADLSVLRSKPASEIGTAGRHMAVGRIVTRWAGGNRLILETAAGSFVTVELCALPAPEIGQTVEVSGMPETDLFRINLCRATWRPAKPIVRHAAARKVSISEMFSDTNGLARIETRLHGKVLTVRGNVRSAFKSQNGEVRLILEDGRHALPVDITACAGMRTPGIGARVEMTGVCVVEADLQRALSSFPRIRDVFLVVSDPSGVTVLSATPFWTPLRLGILIGTLLIILVGILLWNISLRTLVRRKTRELEREITAGVEAELRIHERTRLATELHDTISQNLTGVALALDEVDDAIGDGNADAHARLDIAARTLKSCRGELRNCLWDLRNNALEEPEIDAAIRRTLAPHVRDTNVAVRFNTRREIFSDSTLHTILCIIRELTVNAIRHGNAKNIRIAGILENGELRFSVTDDGRGFDSTNRPGLETGHFGLQGVQERAEGLGGTLTIWSRPGQGSKITISIKIKTASAAQAKT